MKNFRDYLLAAISFVILVSSLVLTGSYASHAAPADKYVTVVNTPSNPVPVVGNVSLTNTPTVQAQQLGQWNVSLSGTPTVQVGNAPNSPLPVRDVDNPARQPFQGELDPLVTVGSFTASDSLSVPAGKRLVIEFASATINTTSGTKMWVRIQTTTNNSTNAHTLVPELQGAFAAGGSDFFVAAQPLKIYADPGTQVTFIVNVLGGVANTNSGAAVVMSGYFVNVP